MKRWLVGLALLLGCADETSSLVVFLQTDLVVGSEIDTAAIEWRRQSDVEWRAYPRLERDVADGLRLAERATPAGPGELSVTLFRAGVEVARRRVVVSVSGATAATVIITRDCVGVECPGSGDATATECLGGRCVDPGCSPETPEVCAPPECDCEMGPSCVESDCLLGACLYKADDSQCASDEVCDLEEGCVLTRDGGLPDANPFDSGDLDAGVTDSGPVAQVDSGADDSGEPDAEVDANVADAGADASAQDAGAVDSSIDTGDMCIQARDTTVGCSSCCVDCEGSCTVVCGTDCLVNCADDADCDVLCLDHTGPCRLIRPPSCDISTEPFTMLMVDIVTLRSGPTTGCDSSAS